MSDQPDLFIPTPDIPAGTTVAGDAVWYCRRRAVWTTDPADLFLTDEQLVAKYGVGAS